MSTTIYDVTHEQLQEWLKRDDGRSGVFVPDRLQYQTVSVGDYVVVSNFAYFGVKFFCAPVLVQVFRIRDKALDYADKNNSAMLDTLEHSCIELEVWHVVDDACDIVEPKMESRDEFYVFGTIDGNQVVQAIFEDVNQARIFAKRIIGYPCDIVEIDVHSSGACSMIHLFHAMRGGWYDSGSNDAVSYLAHTLPSCDDSPIFSVPCNAWQEV